MGPLCSPSKTPNGFPSNLGKSYILMVTFKSYGSHPGLPAAGPLLPLFLLPEIPMPSKFLLAVFLTLFRSQKDLSCLVYLK